MEAEKKNLVEFIELYKSLPSLWKIKSKEYSDRNIKKAQYAVLVRKLKEINPKANREVVTKKINNLRSAYRREFRKKKESLKSGADEYVPTLWYYDMLSFLNDQEESSAEHNTMENNTSLFEESVFGNNNYKPSPRNYEYVDVKSEMPPKRKRPSSTPAPERTLISHNTKSATENMLAYAVKHMDKEEDEYLLMAKTYAMKLKKMAPLQRLYADRIINEILMEGQIGTLERYTSIINPDAQEQIETSSDLVKDSMERY